MALFSNDNIFTEQDSVVSEIDFLLSERTSLPRISHSEAVMMFKKFGKKSNTIKQRTSINDYPKEYFT